MKKSKSDKQEKNKKIIIRPIEKEVSVGDYCKELMKIYGSNVNLARTIPDARDGLKPVMRRILFAMYMLHMTPSSQKLKVARIVGDTLGKYHPHGDASVKESLVGMANWWKTQPLLVAPKGNYGTISGEKSAAMRYIEAGMSKFTYDCFFKDWDINIVELKDNYANNDYEPEYLMAKYPLLLFNGTIGGIGYGLYSGIPCHNIGETVDLIKSIIKNPDKKKVVLIPDFPNGCDIVDCDFQNIYEKGEGNFRMRGRIDITDDGNLIIRSIPYLSTIGAIEDRIIELVKTSKITGLVDMNNSSESVSGNWYGENVDYTDIRLEIILKKGTDPEKIRQMLFKSAGLERTFTVDFRAIYDYEDVQYNLKGYILDWLEFRRDTIRRSTISKYRIQRARFETLECIVKILSKPDFDEKIDKISRVSEDTEDLIKRTMKAFDINYIQATVIAGFKPSQRTKKSLKAYKEEKAKLDIALKKQYELIHDDSLIDEIIIQELDECKKKYSMPRRCKLVKVKQEKDVEDTDHMIVVTKRGLIKKLPFDTTEIGALEAGDKVTNQILINNKDSLLLFDKVGKCYKLKVSDMIDTPLAGVGVDISSYINTEHKIVNIMKMPDEKDKGYFIFATKNGNVKKSEFGNYLNANKGGLTAISLKNSKESKDSLVDVIAIKKAKDVLLYEANGQAIRFSTKDIATTLRMSYGVIGIKVDENDDDKVIGMTIIDKSKKYLAILTDKGNGKKILTENCEKVGRNSDPYSLIKLDGKEKIVSIKPVDEDETVDIMFNNRLETLNVNDIPTMTKIARGKKLVSCKKGEQIIAMI